MSELTFRENTNVLFHRAKVSVELNRREFVERSAERTGNIEAQYVSMLLWREGRQLVQVVWELGRHERRG